MSYYLNEFENNKDYLERGPKAKALTDFNGIPVLAYKNVSDPIQTHMRMMYGHMDWEDYVMKLDEHTLKLIQERDVIGQVSTCRKVRLKVICRR